MSELTTEQISFLEYHNIKIEETFDASGLKPSVWKQRMRDEGRLFAYGVSCFRGHGLKTRSGGCIQCRTANITYARRSISEGYLYAAYSKRSSIFKVGFSSNDPDNRIYIANLDGYAGTNDWRIALKLFSSRAGRLEIEIHKTLKMFNNPRSWIRNWEPTIAREVYSCSFEQIFESICDCTDQDEKNTMMCWMMIK